MIFVKRRDEIGKCWFVYSALCCFWGIGYSFQINNPVDYTIALWASRVSDAFAVWIPAAWIRFIHAFLNLKADKKFFWPVYGISLAIFLTFPTPLFIPFLKNKSPIGFDHFVHGGPSFHFFTALFAALVLYGFYLLLTACRDDRLPYERKRQVRFFLIASGLGFAGGSLAFLPVYDIDLPINYGTLLMPFFPFLLALAITRYRLLDIDELAQVVQRDKLAAVGTLAASINHEIRNPLYIIRGLAESCLTRSLEGRYSSSEETVEKANGVLKKIIDQSQRAMNIMRHFALFAKQSAESQKTNAEPVHLERVVESVLPLARHELELEKIEFLKNIPQALPPIKADPRHLEQIFLNLIVNACQAFKLQSTSCELQAPEAGSLERFDKLAVLSKVEGPVAVKPRIEIAAEQHNGHVNILISDNGPGIPPEQVKKIFEPFYTTKEEGTGLGLYITKQLVERNGGKISVKSKLGKGTTFQLEFKK